MQLRNLILTVSSAALFNTVALAKTSKGDPNCDVNGKKVHVKDEASCTKKKGVWATTATTDLGKAPTPAGATPAATIPAPSEAVPAPTK